MRLIKIFGIVLALHVVPACIFLLIQGCRSTPVRKADTTEADAAVAPLPPASENYYSQGASSTLTPLPVDATADAPAPPLSFGGASSAPLSSLTPAERARAEPMRPTDSTVRVSTNPADVLPPPEPVTYVVRSGDSLWKIAKAHGTTTAELQRLNPGLKADALRPGMSIKIPGTAAPSGAPAAPAFGAAPAAPEVPGTTYIVRSGDSLSKIAARNGTTVAALRTANNLRSDTIQVGQALRIPGAAPAGGAAPTTTPVPAGSTLAGNDQAGRVTVTVQRGDTLGAIAKKFGVTVRDLMNENSISDPTKIRIGQKLVIPGFEAVGTGEVPRTPPASTTRTMTRPPASTPPPSAPTTPTLPPVETLPPDVESPGVDVPVVPLEESPTPTP